MKTIDYSKYTKQQIIDILHLQREIKDFSGKSYPQDLEIYHAEKDTDKAIYKYTLDNYFDGDEQAARAHFLHKVFNTADKGGGVLLARCIKIEKLND